MADWLWPVFTAPGVRAVMTSRQGGVGVGPFDGLNLRPGIGDDPSAVAENRRRLTERLGVPSRRVDQVHGAAVHGFEAMLDAFDAADAAADDGLPVADASVTALAGLACEVQVADCLPVLFADRAGRAVGAAHAGWRGLAAGVLEATLERVCDLAGQPPGQIEAWLGACIGPTQFEVGADVLAAFGAAAPGRGALRFVARPAASAEEPPKWLADLPGLARDRLAAAGVGRVFGNDGSPAWCTVTNPARFFSYRRERHTGRMAALIWRVA